MFHTTIVGKKLNKNIYINRIKWSMKVWEIIEFRISVDNIYQLDTLL